MSWTRWLVDRGALGSTGEPGKHFHELGHEDVLHRHWKRRRGVVRRHAGHREIQRALQGARGVVSVRERWKGEALLQRRQYGGVVVVVLRRLSDDRVFLCIGGGDDGGNAHPQPIEIE